MNQFVQGYVGQSDARLATTYVRGERFGDGAIQQAIENGALLAILNRLRRWFKIEHPNPDDRARAQATASTITYRDIEAVTRQMIFYKVAADGLDTYELMKGRHFDAIFAAIADDPIGETPSAVRTDVERALNVFGPSEPRDSE